MLALPRRFGRPLPHRRTIRAIAGLTSVALIATLLATLVAGPVQAAAGVPAGGNAGPVGGTQLGSTGVVYDSQAGVPAPPAVVASGWVVADLDTGEVLGASDPHGQFGPASTLKVLSALVMLPLIPPEQQITATSAAVNVDGSKVGVVPGHAYSADTLFTGMLVVSGNDATRVLASALGGDDAVLAMMNAKAAELHADDTVAKTVTGLDAPGQSTSAYDLALISRAALQLPAFRNYVAITRTQFAGVDVPGFAISNHNLLLGHYPGAYGVKNGYTDASRATYVGAAQRDGHNLMVTMVRTDPEYRNSAEALLNWGFAADGKVSPVGTLVAPGTPAAAPAPTNEIAAAGTAARIAAPPKAGHRLGGLEYGAIGIAAGVLVLFFARRQQIKRRRRYRRTRLRLPDI